MKRRILSIFLALCMLLSMQPPVAVFAVETERSLVLPTEQEVQQEYATENEPSAEEEVRAPAVAADIGEPEEVDVVLSETAVVTAAELTENDFTYEVINGSYAKLTSYVGEAAELVIPSTVGDYQVQQLEKGLFQDNKTLTKVTIPDSVETVGQGVFSGCSALIQVEVGNGLTALSIRMFEKCAALETVTIGNGVKTIQDYAFYDCTSLKSIALPDNVTTLRNYIFRGCTALTSVDLGSVTTIGYSLFYGCTVLKEIELPATLTTVSSVNADYLLTGSYVETVTISAGMKVIPSNTFRKCVYLKAIAIPDSVTEIGAFAFYGATALEQVNFSTGLHTIGKEAFRNCEKLRSVSLPDGLTTIGENVFYGCTRLESVILPDGLTVLPKETFRDCKALTELTLPDTITTLGYSIFSGCDSLKVVTLPANLTTCNISSSHGPFYNSSVEKVIIPDDFVSQTIPNNCFRYAETLSEVVIPDSIKTIGKHAFYYTTALKNIQLPDHLEKIEGSAFRYSGLNAIHFPDTIDVIGTYAFADCISLRELTLPEGLLTLGTYCFSKCTGLSNAVMPGSLDALPEEAFSGCTGLREVILNEGLKRIGNYAFRYCTSLTELQLPDSITTLGSEIFYDCTGLKHINLPRNLTGPLSGGYSGPFDSSSIESVDIPQGITAIPDRVFYACMNLKEVVLPDSINNIGSRSFASCTALSAIWIGENVKAIDEDAFYDSDGITIHGVAGSYAESYAGANNIPFSTEPLVRDTVVLSGKVLDETGSGVAGVTVKVYDVTLDKEMGIYTTDENGLWSCDKAVKGSAHRVYYSSPYHTLSCYTQTTAELTGPQTLDAVTAILQVDPETVSPAAHFTYTVLNGSYCEITGYTGTDAIVVIPEMIDDYTVQSLANNLFKNKTALTAVVIPNTVTKVGNSLFYGCTGLKFVGIGNGLTALSSNMFQNCTVLEKVSFGMGLNTIKSYAFQSCTALTELCLPDTVTMLETRIFYGCTGLTTINLPLSLTNSGGSFDGPFANSAIVSVNIPEGMTRIPNYTFGSATKLEQVTLPSTLQEIGSYAFYGCSGLKYVILNEGLQIIGSNAFYQCPMETVEFPVSLNTIDSHAFRYCTGLKEVELPNSLSTLGSYAFSDCSNLTRVTLSDGLTTLKNYTFQNCANLQSITIPDTVTKLETRIISGCTGLTKINLPLSLTNSGGSTDGPFANSAIVSVNIPEGMTRIPNYTFGSATKLEQVTLPSTLEEIGNYAFYGCSGLKSIKLNEGLTTIGSHAFYQCSLQSVEFPVSLTAIKENAFNGCSGLVEVVLPEYLTTLGNYAFSGCSALTRVDLPDSLTTLNDYIFLNCTELQEITIPDKVTTLEDQIFSGCTSLKQINLPKDLKTCSNNGSGYGPFGGSGIEEITVPDGMTSIPANTFAGAKNLRKVELPATVTAIKDRAFQNCEALKELWLGPEVEEIGNDTFKNCTQLIIHGVADSYAETYANDHNIPFSTESLDRPTSGLNGTMVDENGNGVAGVVVKVIDVKRGETVGTYTTDENGKWSCQDGIVGNPHQVIYSSPYHTFSSYGTVTEPLTDQAIVLEPVELTQQVDPALETAVEDFTYIQLNAVTCKITAYTGADTVVVVPGSINNYRVTELTSDVFRGNSTVQKVVLPHSVATLGDNAFDNCIALEFVGMGSGLTAIGSYVFRGCKALKQVTFGVNTEIIGPYAFEKCDSLTAITLPGNIKIVDQYAFAGCNSLQMLILTYGLEQVKRQAFANCPVLREIDLPDTVTKLGSMIFQNSGEVTSIILPLALKECENNSYNGPFAEANILTVTIPDGMVAIPDNTFLGCKTIISISLPDSVREIGVGAFREASSLAAVTLNDGLEQIGAYAFASCAFTGIQLPASLQTVQDHAFDSCAKLETITLPQGLTELGSFAFEACTALTTAVLPNSLTTLKERTFLDCTELQFITLPDTITTLGALVFEGCDKLQHINLPKALQSCETINYHGPFAASGITSVTIPEGLAKIPDSTFRKCETLTSVSTPASVKEIGMDAFREASALSAVTLNDGMEQIGAYAFASCSFTDIQLPASMQTIQERAFASCIKLQTITLPQGLTTLGNNAFEGCTALTTAVLPDSLTILNAEIFRDCISLSSVTLPDTMTNMGSLIFTGCSAMKHIALPAALAVCDGTYHGEGPFAGSGVETVDFPKEMTRIPDNLFGQCTSLRTVTLPDTVTEVGKKAFYKASGLEEVTLSNKLMSIGEHAFDSCGMARIQFPDTLTTIDSYAFYSCTDLGEVRLSENITQVGRFAFACCSGLRSIVWNDVLTDIPEYCFSDCDGLVNLTIGESITTIGLYAFESCDNLAEVMIPNTVTTISEGTFYECPKLVIYCYSNSTAHNYAVANSHVYKLLDDHTHEYVLQSETPATCTGSGSRVEACSICGFTQTVLIEALGHSYTQSIVPPECTQQGYTLHTCIKEGCDYFYKTNYVAALGHKYGPWEMVGESSCDKGGTRQRICTVCQHPDIETVAASGHQYSNTVVAPTCTQQGYTLHTCSVCGYNWRDAVTDMLEHVFGLWEEITAPTLLSCGEEARTCSRCDLREIRETDKVTVDVDDPDYGLVHFTLVDATTKKPIPGATLFVATDKDGEGNLALDANGEGSQILPVGKVSVSAFAEGYLLRTVNITVVPGEQTVPAIGISTKPLVEAKITHTEMTLEEIKAAGIDINAADNKHLYKYEAKILFHEEIEITVENIVDSEGTFYKPSTGNSTLAKIRQRFALSHDEATEKAIPVTIYSPGETSYIVDHDDIQSAVWTAQQAAAGWQFTNGGYTFEGYGIPSALYLSEEAAFENVGWTYSGQTLSMTIENDYGDRRSHYLSFYDGHFLTYSDQAKAGEIYLYQKTTDEDGNVIYVLTDTVQDGKQYLIVQEDTKREWSRWAMSHDEELGSSENVLIRGDDLFGTYITDEERLAYAVWDLRGGNASLTLENEEYHPQVKEIITLPNGETDGGVLTFDKALSMAEWTYDGKLYVENGDEDYYLRCTDGSYMVVTDKRLAGAVDFYEKVTVRDDFGRETIIYRLADTIEDGKQYLVIGSGPNPSGGGGGGWGGGGSGHKSSGGINATLSDGTVVTVFPVNEVFYLIIYGEVSWLKEMYDVEMLVINNSDTDTLENCTAELMLPPGLSLATMVEGEQSLIQNIGNVPASGTRSVHWYVRGDEEGSYNVAAALSGTMMPFDEDFYYDFVADSPIKVYAGSAMQLTFHIPEAAYPGEYYPVTIELENVSHKPIYHVRHAITGWEQGKITYQSDGKEEKLVYGEGGFVGSISEDTFYPGDKIVIEVDFKILFESTLMKNLLEAVDGFEDLYQSYKAVSAAMDAMNSLIGFCSSVSKNLDSFIESAANVGDKAVSAVKLAKAVSDLMKEYQKGDSAAVAAVEKLESMGLKATLETLSDPEACQKFLEDNDASVLETLATQFGSLISGESGSDEFDIFDSVRHLISIIPIRFVVDNVIITTMEDSTTTIPHKIVMESVSGRGWGVSNMSKYLYSLAIGALGKVDTPFPLRLAGVSDDVTGYEDAVAYVKQVEQETAHYLVESDGPNVIFMAWIEPNAAKARNASSFTLQTADGVTPDADGILTFTGTQMLEVTANGSVGGTLHISRVGDKDYEKDSTRSYVIQVLEEHDCAGTSWQILVPPMQDAPGYRAMACDVCGDVIRVEPVTLCAEHTYGSWIEDRKPTLTENGIWHRSCSQCGKIEYAYPDKLTDCAHDVVYAYQGEGNAVSFYCDNCQGCYEDEACTKPQLEPAVGTEQAKQILLHVSSELRGKTQQMMLATYSQQGAMEKVWMESVAMEGDALILPSMEQGKTIRVFFLAENYSPVHTAAELKFE